MPPRLSLVSGQPLGGTSNSPGHLEVMLDRRLMQDDNRGLFQVGVEEDQVVVRVKLMVNCLWCRVYFVPLIKRGLILVPQLPGCV